MKSRGIIWLISETRQMANNFIMQELKKHGITELVPSHGNILINLFQNPEMTMSEISKKINRKCNTVTTLINKLVNLDYIQKNTDSSDQRITRISLTIKGKAFEKTFRKISDKLMKITYLGFTEQEKKELSNSLIKINKNFTEYKNYQANQANIENKT